MIRRITVMVGLCAMLGATTLGGSASAGSGHALRYSRPHLAGAVRACAVPKNPNVAACMAMVGTTANGQPFVTPNVLPGYGAPQFEGAYGLPTTAGVPQTIAIVDAFDDPYITSDLATYSTAWGLPVLPTCPNDSATSCFEVLNQDGLTSPLPSADSGWGLEISMDVEVAHAICQDCRIELYEANSASFANLETAVNAAAGRGVQVISNSYGSFGADCSTSSTGGAYNHAGVAITVSAGDSGFGKACPAVLNTVVAVGGTTLNLGPSNTYGSESVWSGTGAGCSTAEPAKPFQKALGAWKKIGCTGRGMNDLSADANPSTGAAVYDSDPAWGGWLEVGGTSLSAPLIGAAYALAHNTTNWTYPGRSGYDTRTGFRDVKLGNDGPCTKAVRCHAASGYDLPTGVGSPNGLTGL